jgi:hypothetical protein
MPVRGRPVIAERLAQALDGPAYTGSQNQYPDGLCAATDDLAPRTLLASIWVTLDQARATAERLPRVVERPSGRAGEGCKSATGGRREASLRRERDDGLLSQPEALTDPPSKVRASPISGPLTGAD